MDPSPAPGGRFLRLLGWVVAVNSLVILVAVATGGSAGEAAAQFALWCGLG